MLQEVAVIDKGADDVRIAKIHAQPHARVLQRAAVVVGDIDGIAQKRLVDRDAGPRDKLEMKLMYVKIVQFRRAVLDDPVLDIALLDDNIRYVRGGIERRRRLAVDGQIKTRGAVWVVWIL